MKKFITLFAVMLCCCTQMFAAFQPEAGKQYLIQDVSSGLYIVLAKGNDSLGGGDNTTGASLAAEGTPFTFTPSGDGFILSDENGKYLGYNSSSYHWNVNTAYSSVWYVLDTEDGNYCVSRSPYSIEQGLGVDNHTQGAGVYTDKSGTINHWDIVEYAASGDTHAAFAIFNGGEPEKMIADGEGGYTVTTTLGVGEHSVTVVYDEVEQGTVHFTTVPFEFDGGTYEEGKVNVYFNPETGEITVTGDGVDNTVVPEPEDLKGLFVLGLDGNWDPAAPAISIETREDGIYNFSCVLDEPAAFMLGTVAPGNGSWETFNANRLNPTEADLELWKGDVAALVLGGEENLFHIAAGTWSFTVNVNDMAITVVEGAAKPFAAVEGQAYHIMMKYNPAWGIDFVNTFEGTDNHANIGATVTATPTKLYLTQGENGWVIGDNAGKFFAPYSQGGALKWSAVVSSEAYEWTVEGTAEDFVLIREDGKYVGKDPTTDHLFADKSGTSIVHFQLVPVQSVWNGEVTYPDAVASTEEVLNFPVTFNDASDISVSNMGLLAAVFDEEGDIYALAMADADEAFDMAGSVSVSGSTATIHFVGIDELMGVNPALVESAAKRIGAFQPTAGKFTVFVAPKSFVVDGTLVSDVLGESYEVNGGMTTGIGSIATETSARIYDMQGRRVVAPAKAGLYIVNGKKVIR